MDQEEILLRDVELSSQRPTPLNPVVVAPMMIFVQLEEASIVASNLASLALNEARNMDVLRDPSLDQMFDISPLSSPTCLTKWIQARHHPSNRSGYDFVSFGAPTVEFGGFYLQKTFFAPPLRKA